MRWRHLPVSVSERGSLQSKVNNQKSTINPVLSHSTDEMELTLLYIPAASTVPIMSSQLISGIYTNLNVRFRLWTMADEQKYLDRGKFLKCARL